MWLWGIRYSKQREILFCVGKIVSFGIKVPFERIGAELVERGMPFEIGVDVVDEEIDLEVEL